MTQEEVLLDVAEILDAAGIQFMVTGSHASSLHGMPRYTNDIDIVIDVTADQLKGLVVLLAGRYYVSPEAARDALAQQSMFNIINFSAGVKADLIIRKNRAFDIELFSRRQTGRVLARDIPFASPEGVILSKLEWDKITPSEKQQRDVLNVLKVRWAVLDKAYLRKWAHELGVAEKLEDLLGEAERLQTP
jgi:hypothetical protein